MGEETDIAEPMSSEDVVAAEDVAADEPSKDQYRKRKKHLYKSLQELMEFYLGDVNLSKDRFIAQKIQGQSFVFIDLAIFLTFNKVRALTSRVEDLAKAISHSEILQLSEDRMQVCRKTPIRKKENEDDCTIYVEPIGPDVDHDLLSKVFSEFGPVDYISLPRFSHNGKFKGFAFVEFRAPEHAQKALEVLGAKGCCLSPHMAPEELMSIRKFEPSSKDNNGTFNKTKYKQNPFKNTRIQPKIEQDAVNNQFDSDKIKSGNNVSEFNENYEQQLGTVVNESIEVSQLKSEEIKGDVVNTDVNVVSTGLREEDKTLPDTEQLDKIENNTYKEEEITIENNEGVHDRETRKGKRKRKYSEGKEKYDQKKPKLSQPKDDDEDSVNNKKNDEKKENITEVGEEYCNLSKGERRKSDVDLSDDGVNRRIKGKKREKTSVKVASAQSGLDECKEMDVNKEEDKSHRKRRKRKHSGDPLADDVSTAEKSERDETESAKKKLKSDTEDGTETETSHAEEQVEDEAVKQKKKRKKRKKVKKEKSTAISLGLKVLPKREWSRLRNKYLNMQKVTMRSLKQHLQYSRWERQKRTPPDERVGEAEKEKEVLPETIIRVTLDEPVSNAKMAKSEMRIHPEIKYVDVSEGSPHVYLRAATPELASTLVNAKHWPNMDLLQGKEEAEYLNKIRMDREQYFNKNRPHQRGRSKLLKRAERFQEKHMTTFET